MQVHFHPSGLFRQSRCSLESWNNHSYDHINDINPSSSKKGIRCYNFLTSLVLRIFGLIHIEKTANGKTVYLNKKSFIKWKEWRGLIEKTASSSLEQQTKKTEAVAESIIIEEPLVIETAQPVVIETAQPVVIDTDQQHDDNDAINLNAAGANFIQTLTNECSEDIGKTWEALLSNIPPELVTGFKSDKTGKYTLTFSRPVTLWLNSRSRSGRHTYPKGGTVVLLGHNDQNQLSFSIETNHRTVRFKNGMNFWCKTPIGVKKVDVVKLKDHGTDQMEIEAGLKVDIGFASIFKSQAETHPKQRFQKVWKEATLLDENQNYKTFLNQKISSESR